MSNRAKEICGTENPDRWMAEIRFQDGTQVTVRFEEIEDLDEIVEQGPDWHTIEQIIITLNRPALEPPKGNA
jgi:hypothetical protein